MRRQKTSYIIVAGIILFSFHAAPFVSPQNASRPEMQGTYFTETGCNHCDSFLYIQKPRLEETYGIHIALETHDILSTKGYELCVEMLEQRGLKFTVFPVLFIGSNVYRGSNAIEENMPKEIEYFLSHGSYMPTIRQTDQSALAAKNSNAAFAASALPTIFAGLLDGINPCAFSTMLFFLSFMALKRKDQRSLLWVGLAFIVSVFIAYFLIGLGLLGALRKYLSENRFSIYIYQHFHICYSRYFCRSKCARCHCCFPGKSFRFRIADANIFQTAESPVHPVLQPTSAVYFWRSDLGPSCIFYRIGVYRPNLPADAGIYEPEHAVFKEHSASAHVQSCLYSSFEPGFCAIFLWSAP